MSLFVSHIEVRNTGLGCSRIFDSDRDGETQEWRGLNNEGLSDLHSSPNFIGVIKSRRMRRAEHVAGMEEERCIESFGKET
jgi:hypothetical protein